MKKLPLHVGGLGFKIGNPPPANLRTRGIVSPQNLYKRLLRGDRIGKAPKGLTTFSNSQRGFRG